MNKNYYFEIIKDNIFSIIIILLNTLSIYLFYYSSLNEKIELIYPIVLSLFFCIIYLLYQIYKNNKFLKNLFNSLDNPYFVFTGKTLNQKKTINAISAIHKNYSEIISKSERDLADYDKFITQWIHNLKTPATVQNLILSQVKNSTLSPEDLSALKHENKFILDNLQNLLNLIRVKEFSKDYVPTTCNITESINKIINANKNLFIFNNVFPKFETPKDPVFVLTDEKWNSFIIQQLISNAVKYSATKNKSKYIILRLTTTYKNNVTLEIKDEGIGIPPYDIERIFDPFFTGENGRSDNSSTGIGLYLASFISKKLNQTLKIESEVDKGTSVIMEYRSSSMKG